MLAGTPEKLLAIASKDFDVNSISLANSILHPFPVFHFSAAGATRAGSPPETNMFEKFLTERNRVLLGSLSHLTASNLPTQSDRSSSPSASDRSLVASAGSFFSQALQQAASILPMGSSNEVKSVVPQVTLLHHSLLGKSFISDHSALASSKWLPPPLGHLASGEKIELKTCAVLLSSS